MWEVIHAQWHLRSIHKSSFGHNLRLSLKHMIDGEFCTSGCSKVEVLPWGIWNGFSSSPECLLFHLSCHQAEQGLGPRMTEDELVGWHHWLNGHEFEQAPGDGERQGSLTCCSPWGDKKIIPDWATEQQQQFPLTCQVNLLVAFALLAFTWESVTEEHLTSCWGLYPPPSAPDHGSELNYTPLPEQNIVLVSFWQGSFDTIDNLVWSL